MVRSRTYYVYIMTNQSRTLYVGFTNNIRRRAWQHKTHQIEGFTQRYNIDTLVYIETFTDVFAAIRREKQIKTWSRKKKLWLIDQQNPDWHDLSDGWYD
jgi:putative endonuclease